MKVLIISQGIDGGIAKMSSYLARSLQKAGHNVDHIYVGRPASSFYPREDAKFGVKSSFYVTGKSRSLSEIIGIIKSFQFLKNNTDTQYDLVILSGLISLILYFRFFKNAYIIFYDHGLPFSFVKIKKFLLRFALPKVNLIVSVADFSLNFYKKISNNYQSVVIENCITNNIISKSENNFSEIKILMLARIDFIQKDQLTLVKAAIRAHKQGLPIKVTFAGGGKDLENLRRYVRKYKCEDFIYVIGHVDNLNILMKENNISCLSSNFESFGLSLFEGVIFGHLGIGSNVTGIKDVSNIDKLAVLFKNGDYKELSEIFWNIYKNEKFYIEFSQTANKIAKKQFSSERYLKQFMKFIDKIEK